MRHAEKHERVTPKQRQEILHLKSPYVGFNKDFKAAIINMFKELKEIMLKEV